MMTRAKPSLSIRVALCLGVLMALGTSQAQSANGPVSSRNSSYVIGAECKRKTDRLPGVYKMDACKRMYCGPKDIKDIIEIIPDFARINHCTWRLVGEMCKCTR